MSEIWYKTSYDNSIKEVTVIKETEKQVVYIDNRFDGTDRQERGSKIGSYSNFFKTYEEAKQFLIDKLAENVRQKEAQLHYAKDQFQKLFDKLNK